MELKIITQPSLEFWREFDRLSDKSFCHNIQFRSCWLIPYIKYLLKGEVYIIAVYVEGKLVGCLPLERIRIRATRFWDFRVFRVLGTGPTDFFEVLVQNDQQGNILNEIFTHLSMNKNWEYLELNLLPQNSPSLGEIHRVFTHRSFEILEKEAIGYRFEKTLGSWETYHLEVFENKNKDLGKGERRLKRNNIEFSFQTYLDNVFERFITNVDLYANRRETLGQYNFYNDTNYRLFLKNVCENYEKYDGVEFTVMKDAREEIVMAFQLDFINKNTRYHWNHAFNEDYRRYSPGKLLLKEILKNSFENPNITSCNHMRGLSKYKEAFTSYEEMMPSFKIKRVNSQRIRITRTVSRVLNLLG